MKKVRNILSIIITGLMLITVSPINASASTNEKPINDIVADNTSFGVKVYTENDGKWCDKENIVFYIGSEHLNYTPYLTVKYSNETKTYNFIEDKLSGKLKATIPVTENGTYLIKLDSEKSMLIEWSGSVTVNNIDVQSPKFKVTKEIDPNRSFVKVNVKSEDAGSGVDNVYIKETGEKISSDDATFKFTKNGVYQMFVVDKAGNKSGYTLEIQEVDNEPPVLYLNYDDSKYVDEGVIKINSGDYYSGFSKVVDLQTNEEYTETEFTVPVTKNGDYSFVAYDNAGNSCKKTITISNIMEGALNYRIEGPSKPINTLNYSTVGLSINPYSDSLDATKCVRKSDGQELGYEVHDGLKYFYDRTIKENGTYEYIVYDEYGRSQELKYEVNCVDNIAPEFRINSGDYVDHTTTVNDVVLSIIPLTKNLGTTKYYYCVNNGEWLLFPGEITISNEGTYSYKFKATSEAGLESQEKPLTVVKTADVANCLSLIGLGLSTMGMGISNRRKRNRK